MCLALVTLMAYDDLRLIEKRGFRSSPASASESRIALYVVGREKDKNPPDHGIIIELNGDYLLGCYRDIQLPDGLIALVLHARSGQPAPECS